MPKSDNQLRITKSVLDRLVDTEPGILSDPPVSSFRALRELKNSVRRDLEWLLNTRQSIAEVPDDYVETVRSLAGFGLPDFTAASVKSSATQDFIRRAIQEEIRLFEPRLTDVSVTIEGGLGTERSLRFRIDAQLRVDPQPEPVSFDTTLQLSSGEYEVKGGE